MNENSSIPERIDPESWDECQRDLEEKYLRSDDKVSTNQQLKDGILREETVIIHKHKNSAGVLVITALVFLLIGALIASGILFARFADIPGLVAGIQGENPDYGHTRPPKETEEPSGAPTDSDNPELTPTAPPLVTPEPGNTDIGGTGAALPLSDIYSACVTGVVLIRNYDSDRINEFHLQSEGSGFFISADGYILTNAHVVEDAVSLTVELYDGTVAEASVIGTDKTNDVAVIRTKDGSGYNALTIGNSDNLKVGEFVLAIGHPTGEELNFSATFGIISALERTVSIDSIMNEYIQIDAAINPGNSGGPLFNMNGEVIGITSAKITTAGYGDDDELIAADGLGFAIPINKAMQIADSIIKNGNAESPGIGVTVITITPAMAEQYGVHEGILVYCVIKDGPGHKAGLYADDIITKADGVVLTSTEQFITIIRSHSVGDSVELEYIRAGETRTCTIIIGDINSIGSEILDNAYGGGDLGLN